MKEDCTRLALCGLDLFEDHYDFHEGLSRTSNEGHPREPIHLLGCSNPVPDTYSEDPDSASN